MTLTPFRGRCHTCGHDHDAEGQTLRDILDTYYAAKQEALAEVEQFREDAERYRWMTEHRLGWFSRSSPLQWGKQSKKDALDAAIDAARKDAV